MTDISDLDLSFVCLQCLQKMQNFLGNLGRAVNKHAPALQDYVGVLG